MNTSEIVKQYQGKSVPDLSYATVRDFCDSADHLSEIMRFDGDMKDVQRTWAIKAVLGKMQIGSKLLEIGAGEPIVANALHQLGYHVTIVDPYDGTGNGPTAYLAYVAKYPHLKIIRAYFQDDISALMQNSFDCIYSISVLEHVHPPKLDNLFAGIKKFLSPGGFSVHCIDHVVGGNTAELGEATVRQILSRQAKLQNPQLDEETILRETNKTIEEYYQKMLSDVETYYHSAQGHNLWRGGRPYDEVPFCRIISTQTVACKSV
jgi:cyclopropane fatty-acyl-phospholipid synthase-like methyltransferase